MRPERDEIRGGARRDRQRASVREAEIISLARPAGVSGSDRCHVGDANKTENVTTPWFVR